MIDMFRDFEKMSAKINRAWVKRVLECPRCAYINRIFEA